MCEEKPLILQIHLAFDLIIKYAFKRYGIAKIEYHERWSYFSKNLRRRAIVVVLAIKVLAFLHDVHHDTILQISYS